MKNCNKTMMLNFSKTISFFVALIFASSVFAQTDYVVTLSNDTIYGKLKFSFYGGKVRLQAKDSSIQCIPENLKAYYKDFDKISYHSLLLPGADKKRWIENEENGRIKLYSQSNSTGGYGGGGRVTNTTWYIQKDDENVRELKTSALFAKTNRNDRQHLFREYLSDNEKVVHQYDETKKFSIKIIKRLIKEYNADY